MNIFFSRIGIVGRSSDPHVNSTIDALTHHLLEQGAEITAQVCTQGIIQAGESLSDALGELGTISDLVIVVGGDGTILGAARELCTFGVPLLGINAGRLGFLADISPKVMREAVSDILIGNFHEEHRFLLEASIGSDQNQTTSALALNDVALHKWNTPRMVKFEIYIDDIFVNIQHSDGLIVATPTGSTAYALSSGGPLLYPSLNALVLVSICPHTLSHRPLVVSGDSHIEIRICDNQNENSRVTCDGQIYLAIPPGENLFIKKATHPIKILHPRYHDHYKILRAKLGWGNICNADLQSI